MVLVARGCVTAATLQIRLRISTAARCDPQKCTFPWWDPARNAWFLGPSRVRSASVSSTNYCGCVQQIDNTQTYLPGVAAPGIDVPSWCTVLVCPFLQPIGLVDYESLKKSICRVRLFLSRFSKQFMDWASTSSCDNLFHLLITLWEKKYKRESQWQCF